MHIDDTATRAAKGAGKPLQARPGRFAAGDLGAGTGTMLAQELWMKTALRAHFRRPNGARIQAADSAQSPARPQFHRLDTTAGLWYNVPVRTCSSMDRAFDYGSAG